MKNILLPLICVHALTLTHAIDHQPDHHHLVKYRDQGDPPPHGYGSRRVKPSYKVVNSRKISPAYPPKSSYGPPPPKYQKKSYYTESPPNFDFRGPTGPSGHNYKNKAFIPPSDTDLHSYPTNHGGTNHGGPPKSHRPPYPTYEEPQKYRGPPKRSPAYEASGYGPPDLGKFGKFGSGPPSVSNHFERPPSSYGPPEISSPSKFKGPIKAMMYLPKGPNPGFVIPEDLPQGYLPTLKGPSTSYGPPKFNPTKSFYFKDSPPFPPKTKHSFSSYFPIKEGKKPFKSFGPPSKLKLYKPLPPSAYGAPSSPSFGGPSPTFGGPSSSSFIPPPSSSVGGPPSSYGAPSATSFGAPTSSSSFGSQPSSSYSAPSHAPPKFNPKPQPQGEFPQSGYGAPNNIPLNNYNNPPAAPTFSSQSSNDYSSYTSHNQGTSFQYQTPHLSYSYSNNPSQSHHYNPPDAPPSQYNPPDLNYVKQPENVQYDLPQKSISYEFHTVANETPKKEQQQQQQQQYHQQNEQQGASSYSSSSYSSYHPTSPDRQNEETNNRYVRGSVTSVSPHEDDDQLKNVEIHLQSSKKPPMGFSKPMDSEKDYEENVYGKKIMNQDGQSQSS